MILAAGYGTRLRPLTENIPKPLVPVMNTPLILHNLLYLKKYGISEVIINTHYLPEMIPDYLGDGTKWGLKLQYSEESDILGTAGGILKARDFLSDDTFVVMNSDILIQTDLADAISCHRENNALGTMIVSNRPDTSRYGVVGLDNDSLVRRITEQVGSNRDDLIPTVFLGIHILEPEIFNYFPQSTAPTCINADVYPQAINSGGRIIGYMQRSGYWNDLGTPGDYLAAHWDILDGKSIQIAAKHDPPHLHSSARVIGPVHIGSGVTIDAGAVVGPYCVLGDRVRVGENSRISKSIIWENVDIPKDTQITGSILADSPRPGIYCEKIFTSYGTYNL